MARVGQKHTKWWDEYASVRFKPYFKSNEEFMKAVNKKQKKVAVPKAPKVIKNDHSYVVLEPCDFEDPYLVSFSTVAEAEKHITEKLKDSRTHPYSNEFHIYERIAVMRRAPQQFSALVMVSEVEAIK